MGNFLCWTFYECLEALIEKTKEQAYPVTIHSDQGSVYSLNGFFQAHKDYTNIWQSMSRVGTPTDNPIIESLNGWIKEEMKIDFGLRSAEGISSFIDDYVFASTIKGALSNSIIKPLFNLR